MSLSTVFSEAVDLIRRNVYALLVIGGIVFVPADLLAALVDDSRGWDASPGRLALFTLALVLPWTLALAAMIAAIAVEPEGAEEEPQTPLAALRDAGARWRALIAIVLVGGLATLAGLVLIVPGLVLATWWLLAFQAAVIESADWRRSLGRSRELVRNSFWAVLFTLVVVTVAVGLFDYAVYRIADASLPSLLAGWVSGVVSDTVATGVFAAVTTAVYWELTGYRRASA